MFDSSRVDDSLRRLVRNFSVRQLEAVPHPRIERSLTAISSIVLLGVLGVIARQLMRAWPPDIPTLMVGLICAALLTALGLCRQKRAQIALSLLTVFVGLYFIELGIVIFKKRVRAQYNYELSAVKAVINLRRAGTNAYPALYRVPPPTNEVHDPGLIPLSAISRVVTVLGNETGRPAVHLSDEFGFCNPAGWSNLPPGRAITIVGDSFVHGASVDPHETIAARMNARDESDDYQYVSLGMKASGPLRSLGAIVEYARRLKPQYVFWCFFEGNDLRDLRAAGRSGLMRYLEDPTFQQDLWNRQHEIDEIGKTYMDGVVKRAEQHVEKRSFGFQRILFLSELRKRMNYHLTSPKFPVEKLWVQMYSRILERARSEVESWGGKLVFVYLPQIERYNSPRYRDFEGIRREVLACAKERDLPIIDLHEEMFEPVEDHRDYFPHPLLGHYNAKGYDKVAEILLRYLSEVDSGRR